MTTAQQYIPRRPTQPGEPVGPVRAIGNYFRKGFQFSGRASRSEYWWIWLYSMILSGCTSYAKDSEAWERFTRAESVAAIILTLVVLVVSLLLVVFTISLTVRRLHDTNRSGWWYLLNLIPVLGSIILFFMLLFRSAPEGMRFDNPYPRRPQENATA